ncbi:MAG TPA: L-seryl-tRNA selenium transferase, partial [Chloroflexota bacterium]|nr:L-seryl-tRNA selenium transferase [Chloroflexota bacterium]
GIGRPCKVGREEVVGLLTALMAYVRRDHAADLTCWQALAQRMAEGLSGILGVQVTSNDGATSGRPSVTLQLDEQALGKTAVQVSNTLADGDPIVAVGTSSVDHGRLTLGTMCLADGEEEIVVRRLREVLVSR